MFYFKSLNKKENQAASDNSTTKQNRKLKALSIFQIKNSTTVQTSVEAIQLKPIHVFTILVKIIFKNVV